MDAALPLQAGRCAPAADPAGQATEAAQASTATEAEGEVMKTNPPRRSALDVILLGYAQTAILVGLVVLAAGVPTW